MRNVEVFTDADWVVPLVIASQQVNIAYVWGNLVTWRSKKQSVGSRNIAEADGEC